LFVHWYSVKTSFGSCASVHVFGAELNGFTSTTGSMTVS
jgi:hypothetical protein